MGNRITATPSPAGSTSGAMALATSQLSSQHERLILELLPFKDAAQFHAWLQGPFVRGSWNEFCYDLLAKLPVVPEPDKAKVSEAARNAINSRNPKYMTYFPEKQGWQLEDHYIRFIVTVVGDNMLKNLWSESEWKKKGLEITKAVYEVLSFLRATSFVPEANPPSYSR